MQEGSLRSVIEDSRKRLATGRPPLITWRQHRKWGRVLFKVEWLDEYIESGIAEPEQLLPPLPAKARRIGLQVVHLPQDNHGIDPALLK